ncbi:MAG: hypothetical protein M3081_11260 [Gemmatimonadota bacterium]|nr:hypothetical protein [Gemmatimonadota bacterium]
MLEYVAAHPPMIGVNIDEDTMLVLLGDGAEVFGTGKVAIFDPAANKNEAAQRLSAGQRSAFQW